MAVCIGPNKQALIAVPGLPQRIKIFVGNILSPPETAHSGEATVTISDAMTFALKDEESMEEVLGDCNMDRAILFAKQGDLPRAMVELAFIAVKEEKSNLAWEMIQRSMTCIPESIEKCIEGAAASPLPDDDDEHLAHHGDRRHTLRGRRRYDNIYVKQRCIRDIGVDMFYPVVLKHEMEGYKLSVKVFQTENLSRRIKATLITPKHVLIKLVKEITGISLFGIAISKEARKTNSYDIEQDQAGHSLLQGYFGSEGFEWISGALLSNRVGVDERSNAIGYLPKSKLVCETGGLFLNEPLKASVEYLNCVTDGNQVLVDWGPELGAVKVEKRPEISGTLLYGQEVQRDVAGSHGNDASSPGDTWPRRTRHWTTARLKRLIYNNVRLC